MRHGVDGRKFDRPTDERLAMFRNLVKALIDNEYLTTTVPRAKEVRSIAERFITLGKDNTLASRRQALAFVNDKDVVTKLFDDVAPRYAERAGGYTRIVKLGPRRGDSAPMARLELV
jgi:large subunit ribosomal protein L17